MNRTKVIVQSIPREFFADEDLREKSEFLKQFFSTFGPADSTYLSSPDPWFKDNFAHVVFANAQDALSVLNASLYRAIKINEKVLTLTLVYEDEAPIEVLDDHCLLKICKMLDQQNKLAVEGVCKRWERLALRSWCSYKSIFVDTLTSLQELEKYTIRCGEYINRVTCTTFIHPSYLSLIGQHCKHTRELFITVIHDSTDENDEDGFSKSFSMMLKNMADLVCLKLTDIYKNFKFDFAQTLPINMREISFSVYELFIDRPESRAPISLDLGRFQNLTALTLKRFIIDAGALNGIEGLQNLATLDLEDSQVHPSNIENVQNLTKLRNLIIPGCLIGDDVLVKIVTNNRELEVLNLNRIVSLTDHSLMVVSTLPKLKRLSINGLCKVKFNFMDKMSTLEELHCENCCFGDTELTKLVQTSPKLKALSIVKCRVTRNFFVAANSAVEMRKNDNKLTIFMSVNVQRYIKEEHIPMLRIFCLSVPS